jgi:TPP-dependent pyruvate/acetoin dehydrogenase alpha subunit
MSAATKAPRGQLLAFLGEMLLIRRFEEKVTERFRAGELAGLLHAAIGQEAVAVEGCSHGYGGSMHLYDVNMGANAVVGGRLPATVGAALALTLRGQPRVAIAFFGDGATNTGAFHESLNLAQLWQLPVVFVCENNRWSESTPQSQHQPIQDLTQGDAAFGMRALHVDGQDVEAVHVAALDALQHARAGRGPVLLVCETERLTGHYIGDPQVYRDKDELRNLQETRDPIESLRRRLELSEEDWVGLDREAQRVVDASVEFAQAGTDPRPSDALNYVYAPTLATKAPTGAERRDR